MAWKWPLALATALTTAVVLAEDAGWLTEITIVAPGVAVPLTTVEVPVVGGGDAIDIFSVAGGPSLA